MAIFETFDHLSRLLASRAKLAGGAKLAAAVERLARYADPESPEMKAFLAREADTSEKIPLAGEELFVLENVYHTKPRADGFFESHRDYVDLQCVVEGEEFIEVLDIRKLEVEKDYDPARDLVTYALPKRASKLLVGAGEAVLFHPGDGHMPCVSVLKPRLVRKAVFKIRLGIF